MIKRILLSIFIVISALFVFPQNALAQISCSIVLIPDPPVENEELIVRGTGCDTDAGNIHILLYAGDDAFFENPLVSLPSGTDTLGADSDGVFQISVGIFNAEDYILQVREGSTQEIIQFTVGEGPEDPEDPEDPDPEVAACGEYNPVGCTDCCPAACPVSLDPPFFCTCGGFDQIACPINNTLDLPECVDDALPDGDGICRFVPFGEDVPFFRCGSVVPVGTIRFTCQPGCNYDSLSQTCACGMSNKSCCPLESSPEDFDNGTCNERRYSCVSGRCIIQTDAPPSIGIFCDDTDAIQTALGCFDLNSPIDFFARAIGFLLGLGGAITLILIAYAALRIQTSQGNPPAVASAKETLMSAISGLLMVVLSVYILRVIGVDILGLFS